MCVASARSARPGPSAGPAGGLAKAIAGPAASFAIACFLREMPLGVIGTGVTAGLLRRRALSGRALRRGCCMLQMITGMPFLPRAT